MPQPRRPWSRVEYDRLDELLAAGYRYADIAADLGRGVIETRGTAQRIGLTHKARMGWRRRDWAPIDAAIIDCIEARCLSVPQAARHLTALGTPVAAGTIYKRLAAMPSQVRKQATENGRRRKRSNAERMRMRVKRAA
ncbi:hypothetical protein M8009_12870 [Halomonas sp. ATCH28]|uniref:GcrA cell cycle regulator n=1 Tax=Halomonas gemina TaxID=2945105 RepID=A0ABT0T2S8_9GAMM|nr:hypothetical protein [Halomonas gemina]MCL7941178.1 hypothetical protein [Halomonas gemina]